MSSSPIVRCVSTLAVLVAMTGGNLQAQGVPQPVPASSPSSAGLSQQTSLAASADTRHRAEVSYQMGKLTVIADNSSLNQILQDIASRIGMKIVGSAPDQRVFGTYGPAAPSEILSDLLDGAGTNMMLLESASGVPNQLVLTSAQGGATPPMEPEPAVSSYAAPSYTAPSYAAPSAPKPVPVPASAYVPSAPASSSQPAPPRPAYSSPQVPSPSSEPAQVSPPEPSASAGDSQPPAVSSPAKPGAPLTPQQIYQQLLELQQKQAQSPGSTK